jgi:large subunit ribosomal protein L6
MSRIGRTPVIIPAGVTVTVDASFITVKGPKGELKEAVFPGVNLVQEDGKITVTRDNDERALRAGHGLIRSLVSNMIEGVTKGYQKNLELVGTGYRVATKGAGLSFSLGYSHPIDVVAPEGITFKIEGNNKVAITGISKYMVGQVAAKIRELRPPEPYKGKGVRYEGEVVRRKAGKAAKTAGGK